MGLRIAIFGQAAFGRDVTERLAEAGHEVVGVYAPPAGARPDPLAELAEERGWRLLRPKRFRRKGSAIAELVDEYASLGAELNVMPFTTVILPPEITDHPPRGSVCFHPSLLPAFRGGNALAWQIILGATETGVSVFQVDAGVDEGPLVVQKDGVEIGPTDTAASLYFDKLYPLGIEAMVEGVDAVASGSAKPTPQPGEGASFQGLVTDEDARVDWSRPAREIDCLVRGCDPQPGAFGLLADGVPVRLFAGRLRPEASDAEPGTVVAIEGAKLIVAAAGGVIEVGRVRVGDGKKVAAAESSLRPGARLR